MDMPAAKRVKRDKIVSDSDSDSDSDYATVNAMDTDSDETTYEMLTKSSKMIGKNVQPLVLKVPRKYTRIPKKLPNPSSQLVSEKRKRKTPISADQFEALNRMPLDNICLFADSSADFKEIAEKFFVVKYRNMQLSLLADPQTGKYSLDKVRRLIRNFGHLIWSLSINLEDLDNPNYCADLITLIRSSCIHTLGWLVL